MLSSLDSRSRKIFQYIVESYLETGNPVGSNTLSKKISPSLASATIRSVMSNLEGLNSPILLRRTISHDSINNDISNNAVNILNNESDSNIIDNIMQNMTDELARQYINNLVQADSSIPNLLREGNINLEYSVFLPNTNSYYTYRTRNNDSSTNNI